jgi:hypothetical protein
MEGGTTISTGSHDEQSTAKHSTAPLAPKAKEVVAQLK